MLSGFSTSVKCSLRGGFTLIEISIVLIIIGFIVGGILTGQHLIDGATVRAQMSQIEKYQTAVRTFQGKYGHLPGDMPDPYANQFGFMVRGTSPGQGDGNGLVQGNYSPTTANNYLQNGEELMFWVDLSRAGLIDSSINTATATAINCGALPSVTQSTSPSLSNYFPTARAGNGTIVYVASQNGVNMFGVLGFVTSGAWWGLGNDGTLGNPSGMLTPVMAQAIDAKADDGFPRSGGVQANMVNNVSGVVPWRQLTSASALSCADQGGVGGAPYRYSVAYNGGLNTTCALTFNF